MRMLLPLLILPLLACGDPAATIEIGTGARAFEPLTPKQDLGIVAGSQGGYHFIINARIRGLLPGDPGQPGALGNPLTRFEVYLDDKRVDIMAPPYRLGYRDSAEDWHEMPSGRILQLSDQLIADENLIPDIYGKEVRIETYVRDARGDEASDVEWVVAVEAEGDGL